MVTMSDIRKDMPVFDSTGQRIGRIDDVDGDRIKITREGSPDGEHHYAGRGDIARVDDAVHLNKSHAALHRHGAAGAGGAAAAGARPAYTKLLPWLLAGLLLLALIIGLSQCDRDDARTADPALTPVGEENVAVARVPGAPLREGSLAYEVDAFLAGEDGTPRTFTFERINFDSGTANLREADKSDLDDLGRVLAAHPDARAAVVGYTDAEGPAASNLELGAERARAVIAALAARGVDPDRLEARTGGERDPTATNTTAGGKFENRRTELIILKR